ncbi:hypothetical protein SDC9_211078 [bioreactor metagenome]|uniref:Uncharacterized protein n=1 Tax=bioreactor metagenome TaxID=1076179 RepID=A0A645JJM3_9ZZZZ
MRLDGRDLVLAASGLLERCDGLGRDAGADGVGNGAGGDADEALSRLHGGCRDNRCTLVGFFGRLRRLLLAELVFDHAGEQRRVALGFEQFGLQGVDAGDPDLFLYG